MFGNGDQESRLRDSAAETARHSRPMSGQSYRVPADKPEKKFITTTYTGSDGVPHEYALVAIDDFADVTILPTPQPPPPYLVPNQNLLANFHFDEGTLAPWQPRGTSAEGGTTNWELSKSRAPLDITFQQLGPGGGGVRYLTINTNGTPAPNQQVFQDIPVAGLKDGNYTASLRMRAQSGTGTLQFRLEQVDANGTVLTTPLDKTVSVPSSNLKTGAESVVLASTVFQESGPVAIDRRAAFLRLSISPRTPGNFDIIEANVTSEKGGSLPAAAR
jgi:hypothetical protein